MGIIFHHPDHEGDELEVCTPEEPREYNGLAFNATSASGRTFQGAYLDRDSVLSLIQALTEWAYPTHIPEGPNRSLIEELIVKAVKDQVSAVLPLHLSPVSSVETVGWDAVRGANGDIVAFQYPGMTEHRPQECPGAGRCPEAEPCNEPLRPGQILMETHKECGLLWVTHRPEEDPEADPEPGDVGHPRPPAAEDGPCADCHHSKDRHRPACAVVHVGVRNVQEAGVCRCNAYKAPAAEVTPPETCRCGHGKDRHRPHCAVVMRDDHGVICRCDGFGPSLPERKTCPHGLGWSMRCGKCETPRPVEPIAFKPPYCGLCKQPWSDGHGQPGDPCPGVEEARQHPGDWTDALWRVRPSAPASEARYCDGCGHSWESHDPECGATRGKGRCECDRRPE